MRSLMLTLFLLGLVGCMSLDGKEVVRSYPLEAKWRPLKEIRQDPTMLLSGATITTVGDTAYVADVPKWLSKHLPGSREFKARMAHEQIHSIRQLKKGTYTWVAKYLWDRKFMWEEESRGWYLEIKALQASGKWVSPEGVAVILKGYQNIRGRMVGYEEALQWVKDVLSGKWTP